jgi:diaminopimelate epimerase
VLSFRKYHGLGNDFLVVDRMEGGRALGSREVRWLCDRHRGVGADGVLLAWSESGIAGRMQLLNADGSEADTCGNGLRCLAQFLADAGYPVGDEIVLRSGQGLHTCTRTGLGRYRVTMGNAEFPHPDVPHERPAHLEAAGATFAATCMVVGNPHAVIRADDPAAEAQRVGAALERHPAFPRRANIIFARPRPGGFDAVVHERGVGITEACGSGACALGVAAVANDWAVAGEPMEVHLPGGMLTIEVSPNGEISQEGPATFVFAGEVELP